MARVRLEEKPKPEPKREIRGITREIIYIDDSCAWPSLEEFCKRYVGETRVFTRFERAQR